LRFVETKFKGNDKTQKATIYLDLINFNSNCLRSTLHTLS